jgi:oxygen-independent coproporphyrinogen-3 oxidase
MRRLAGALPGPYPLSPAAAGSHEPGRQEAMSDRIITQLRLLAEGLDLKEFELTFGRALTDAFPGTVELLEEWDMVRRDHGRLTLSRRGWFLSNQVFYRFL